jgi:hypothetical protein
VYFGTVKKNITIIPDYLLERDGRYAWILDAKAPSENIDTGKNVEQAYSYAMHRDIRVPLYDLCNGRKLIVFHVAQEKPVVDVPLCEIKENWPMLLTIIGCRSAWPNGLRPGFRPDLGLALFKAGFAEAADGKKYFHIFMSLPIMMTARIEDNLYTFTALLSSPLFEDENQMFIGSFDFDSALYPGFLTQFNSELGEGVRSALSRQPYKVTFQPAICPELTFEAELGDATFTNENESYRPFIVRGFI